MTQYYNILYNRPEHLHRFYQEISKVGRVGSDGVMRNFSTLQVSIINCLAEFGRMRLMILLP